MGCLAWEMRGLIFKCNSVSVIFVLAFVRGIAEGAFAFFHVLFFGRLRFFVSFLICLSISFSACSFDSHSLMKVKCSLSLMNMRWRMYKKMLIHMMVAWWGLFSSGVRRRWCSFSFI